MNFRAAWSLSAAMAAAAQPMVVDLREAAKLDQAGRCGEAEKIYQRALAQSGAPAPSLLNNTANHYLACKQPGRARSYFEQLLQVAPAHANANLQLARLDLAEGAAAKAEERLAKVAAARPGDFDVLLLLGSAAARAGHAARARTVLEAALALRPDDPSATVEAGLANAAAGDFPRAVFLLARARSRAPSHRGIALALARAAEDAGYYGDAVEAYDHYLALAPQDAAARRDQARARAFTASGREQGARELAGYVERNPRDPLGHFYLAQMRWSEDADSALASLAEAVRLDPSLAAAHVARAWLLHRMGRGEEALPHLESALRIAPDNVRALDQRGVVLLALERAAEAEAALRRAAALAPQDADVALHLGRALMDQGKEAEGRQWLEAYRKLRPARQRDARRESGMVELATLDPAARRAREIDRFRTMARSRPDDPLLEAHLAGLLLADGQRAEALREYGVLAGTQAERSIWEQAGRALLDAGEYGAARPFLERSGMRRELAVVLLRTEGADAALAVLDAIPEAERDAAVLVARAGALDAAGRGEESARALAGALARGTLDAAAARDAGLLLARQGRAREAVDVVTRAVTAAPFNPELRLAEAVALAADNDLRAAESRVRQMEGRWPEWDRPWQLHAALLAAAGRREEAAAKLQQAAALGRRGDPPRCATLREWISGVCAR